VCSSSVRGLPMKIKDVDAQTALGLLMIQIFLAIRSPAGKQRVIDFAQSVLDEEKIPAEHTDSR
jgi:hypothetical protein